MPVQTISAGSISTCLAGWDNTNAANAQAGTHIVVNPDGAGVGRIGQNFSTPTYECWHYLISFDSSSIPADATINLPTVLKIMIPTWSPGDHSGTDFDIRAYTLAFGTVDIADWPTPASLISLTPLAHLNTYGISEGVYVPMVTDDLRNAIVKGGQTQIVLSSSRAISGDSPTAEEYVYITGVDLEVDWTAGAGGGTDSGWDVASGVGTVTPALGEDYTAVLTSVDEQDLTIKAKFSTDKVAVGGEQSFGLILRYIDVNNYLYAILSATPSNQFTLMICEKLVGVETVLTSLSLSQLNLTAGTPVWLQANAVGINPTTIQLKCWRDDQPEVAEYQLSASSSSAAFQTTGAIGLRFSLAAAVTNYPVTFSVDDLVAS